MPTLFRLIVILAILAGLGAGVLFVVIGVAALLHQLEIWELELSFVLPLLLIVVGMSILVGWAASTRRRSP